MASGDILLDSDGNEILDANGNRQLDDGSGNSCCCGGSPCQYCTTGAEPATILITITGYFSYACTNQPAFPGSWLQTAGPDCTTACLRRIGPCVWASDDFHISADYYFDVGCVPPVHSSHDFTIKYFITLGPDGWKFTIGGPCFPDTEPDPTNGLTAPFVSCSDPISFSYVASGTCTGLQYSVAATPGGCS